MTILDRRYFVLRRLALGCALAVLAVTILSAYLRLSKIGLGCDNWPQCYGQQQRQLQQGQAHSGADSVAIGAARAVHRALAVAALLLIIVMLVVSFGSAPVLQSEGLLALALLVLALALAVLGRWSSAARVPAVAMGNLLGGFAMLALCTRLALAGRTQAWPRLRGWALAATVLLVVQVALGGLVSASFAGLSCSGDAPCSLWPALQQSGLGVLNPWREPVLADTAPFNSDGVSAHSLHRLMAWLVAALLLPLALLAWRRGRRRTAALLVGVLLAQLLVGVVMAQLGLPLALALAHNLLAALLLATLVLLV